MKGGADLAPRLYISTIAPDAAAMARRWGLGLELAHFCAALNLEGERRSVTEEAMRRDMAAAARFVLHAPFCELTPAAVDPLIGQVSRRRYQQSFDLAWAHGVKRLVIHSGFVPNVYFDQWFTEQAPVFWQEFLADKPAGCRLLLENVLDSGPHLLRAVVERVNDPRLRVCFDAAHAAIYSPVPLEEWIDVLGPYIDHVHVHDNQGQADQHLALGQGTLPWERLLSRLERQASPPSYTLETLPAAPALAWLAQQGFLHAAGLQQGLIL